MRITSMALEKIALSNKIKACICYELDKSYPTVQKWIAENKPNGPLTTVAVQKILARELNIRQSELLQETP